MVFFFDEDCFKLGKYLIFVKEVWFCEIMMIEGKRKIYVLIIFFVLLDEFEVIMNNLKFLIV